MNSSQSSGVATEIDTSETQNLNEATAPSTLDDDDSKNSNDQCEMESNNGETSDPNSSEARNAGDSSDAVNPYAYLDRKEFTSERFKIEVSGLPKYYGFGELRKLFLNKMKMTPHKIIPPKKGCSYMFVNFKSEEERQLAVEKIDGYVWKGRTLSAKLAKAAEDPLVKKRMAEEINKTQDGFVPDETVAEIIRRVTSPWWNVPYLEQLDRKMKLITKVFSEMKFKMCKVNKDLTDAPVWNNDIIENILPSPITEGYRNKCEFSIGYNPESKEKTVGFRLTSYKKGSTAVGPVDNVTHIPACMLQIALKFQEFIRLSKLELYDPETHQGCFRQLTVRTNTSDHMLIIVVLNPKQLTTEEFDGLKEELIAKFSAESNIKSFYLKFVNDHGNPDNQPPTLLFGAATITQELLGLKFEISPEAFFQINVPATEVLYKAIGAFLEAQKKVTLLDVCSGTGTIGLSLSNKCSEVLGIEMVSSAVADAQKNAENNGLGEKCTFFAGKAEDITEPVIARAMSEGIIAIVDPPRAGLHQKVLFTLRKCDKIQTLIYVSCDAKAALKNFIDLARPSSNAFRGKPFVPVKLIPVDLFPNSPHFELIIVFKRLANVNEDSDVN